MASLCARCVMVAGLLLCGCDDRSAPAGKGGSAAQSGSAGAGGGGIGGGGGTGESAGAAVVRVGSMAPALKVGGWVKGSGPKDGEFAQGTVYVIDFWATWCGPCIDMMPHLSELSKKHAGKVVVIGVSVWEQTADVAVVKAFVEKMGGQMAYVVGHDDAGGNSGTVAKTWLAGANRTTIPTAMIVDQLGKIAWIGHPADGMDAVLEQVMAGTYDAIPAEAKRLENNTEMNRRGAMFQDAMALSMSGKHEQALKLVDEVLKVETEARGRARVLKGKFEILARKDEAQAFAFAREMLAGELKDADGALFELAETIVRSRTLKAPDYATAVLLARRADEITLGQSASVLNLLALAQFKAGDKNGAMTTQIRAIKVLEKAGDQADEDAAITARKQADMFGGK